MKEFIIILLIGTALALFVPPACGRKGPDAPPDTIPPTVSSTSPQYGEQDVPVNAGIAVTFSEEMDPSTINNQTLLLSRGGSAVGGSVTYSAKTALFTPDANLNANSLHTLSVNVGVKDVAGNAMVAPYFCTFTTGTRTVSGSYTVTPSAGPNGALSPNSAQQVNYNSTVKFTVTPDPGYNISSVTGCGGGLAGNVYTTGPVTANCTVTATFAPAGSTAHIITASAGANGSISPSGSVTVNQGASQSFTISPNSGYHIANVLVDGASAGAVTTYLFSNVTADHAITASFEANATTRYTITASAGSNGTITPSGSVTVNQGASQSFTVSPNAGYHISDVSVDGNSIGSQSSYTFNNVTANHTIKASFAINTYTITATAGEGGKISCSPSPVNYGSNSVCRISNDHDYRIADVVVDGVSVGNVSSYTFRNVIANHTITASFGRH